MDPDSSSARLASPQTWNRYISVNNNPLKFVDPDGRAAVFFIIGHGYKDVKSSFGHAAYLATSEGKRASVSRGTATQLNPSVAQFVNTYLEEGRTVTAVVLKNDPARDAKLFERATKAFPLFDEFRQNCTTACGEALRFSGVLKSDQRPESGTFYDNPDKLLDAFESGLLKDTVEKIYVWDPEKLKEVSPDDIMAVLGIADVATPGVDR